MLRDEISRIIYEAIREGATWSNRSIVPERWEKQTRNLIIEPKPVKPISNLWRGKMRSIKFRAGMKAECCNPDCGWVGDISETIRWKHDVWMCPECHEVCEITKEDGDEG